MPPCCSVVLPTRNRCELLKRAVGSVLAQTCPEFELLIVDDGSDDDTRKWAQSLTDDRVRYSRLDTRKGVSAARNVGIRAARARIVSFLDDDDEMLPLYVARMTSTMDSLSEQVGFCWAGIRKIGGTGRPGDPKDEVDLAKYPGEKGYLGIGTGFGLAVRRHVFEKAGYFDEALPAGGDFEFLIRMGQSFRGVAIGEVLVNVYAHESERVTDATAIRLESYLRILDKQMRFFQANPDVGLKFRRKVAILAYRIGKETVGKRLLLENLRVAPFHWPSWKTLLAFALKPHRPG